MDKSRYSSLLADLEKTKDKYPETVHDAYIKASTYKIIPFNRNKWSSYISNDSVFKVNHKKKSNNNNLSIKSPHYNKKKTDDNSENNNKSNNKLLLKKNGKPVECYDCVRRKPICI